MAVELAPRGPNESAKEARERRQKAMVDAWNVLDKDEQAATAQIAALDAQIVYAVPPTTPPTISVPLSSQQKEARAENEAKVGVAQTNKDRIEKEWKDEFHCPFNRWLGQIEKSAEESRTDQLITASDTQGQLQDLRTEFISYVQDKETVGLAAQHLLDAAILPSDLRGGSNVARAASAVLPANLAADFRERLKVPGSPEYLAAVAELAPLADAIQPVYDGIAQLAEASRDLEKGVILGRTADAAKDILHNPASLGKVAIGLLGAWAVFSAVGGPSDGKKKWIKGILGALGIAVGASAFIDKETLSNLSPKDWIEKQMGHRMDEIFSTATMDKVRHFFDGMPTSDTDAVDDMIRVVDAPIDMFGDMMHAALTVHSREVESARLLNNGLSEKEFKYADKGSLYTAGKWMFMECYNVALAKGECTPAVGDDAQCAAGIDWAKKKKCKVGTLLVELEIVKTAGNTPASTPLAFEGMIGNRNLAELETKDPAFAKVLEPTDQPDVYLINGYPVRYNYTDAGDHVFTDILGRTQFVKVDKSFTGDALQSTLLRIAEDAKKEALKIYRTSALGTFALDLKYNNKGDWILDPPPDRVTHAGLPTYLRGPNDPKVPVILYFDTTYNEVKIGMDSNGDGVPEPRIVPYASLHQVAEEFEKTILHDRIAAETKRTLLVPSFKVVSYRDVGTDTEVDITYGSGAKGTMTYGADTLKSYTLSPDAGLEANWGKSATEACKRNVLGDPRVQDALLRATTGYTEYNRGLMAGLVSKFVGLAKDGVDWFTNDSIQEAFEDDWEKQVVGKMTDLLYDPVNGLSAKYVNAVFKTFPSDAAFQGVEDIFINTQVSSIAGAGVVTATVTPEVLPDSTLQPGDALKMARDVSPKGGTGTIRAALETLKTETPANMPSWFQSAWQGAKNTFTSDAIRTEYYEKKVAEYQGKLERNINGLIVTPAGPAPLGVPALTPVQPTRKQVEAEIARIQLQAQTEAINYTGLDNPAAIKQLLLAPAENAHPEWKDASDKVVGYLTKNMKWEKYAVMPSPENMAQVLDLWYERVGAANLAAGATVTTGEPMQFADYFIWEQQIRFGGHQDYSPDRFYGNVQSVSDTNFNSMITSLRSSVVAYDPTWKAPPLRYLRSNPPDMPPSLELLRTAKRKEFNDWFEVSGDCAKYLRMDGEWPKIFRISVQARLSQIIDNPYQTEASLKQDIDDFKIWVDLERSNIFEPLIGRTDAKNHGYQVNTHIINSMLSYFNFTPRSVGQTLYTDLITAEMQVLR